MKNDKWKEDTMILVSRETRSVVKLEAVKAGMTIKDFIEYLVTFWKKHEK